MQQIIYIHGGMVFNTHEDFIENLKTRSVFKDRMMKKDFWFDKLDESLGGEVEVIYPSMPNKQNANYGEWSLWFSRVEEIIEPDAVIIGHSLGALFLAKYLAHNKLKSQAKTIIMLAGPYNDDSLEDLGDFKLSESDNLNNIYESTGSVVIVHEYDDPVINIEEQELYQKALPTARYVKIEGTDHMMVEEQQKLIDIIKQVINR